MSFDLKSSWHLVYFMLYDELFQRLGAYLLKLLSSPVTSLVLGTLRRRSPLAVDRYMFGMVASAPDKQWPAPYFILVSQWKSVFFVFYLFIHQFH